MEQDVFTVFAHGRLADANGQIEFSRLEWKAHPQFAGVFLKNLVAPEQTHGLLTCHLVRIEPGCAIGRHLHPASIELHEVVEGEGVCRTEGGDIGYVPGTLAVMPAGSPHEIVAGDRGLSLFAKFVTAAI
ncbi:MAG: cupin domain-containing protein [Candidatus Accumulibacter sp.]|jgi:quercetin dioxygenase-like cupin family protein|nr:cupin domain-containing protein [Accumulibacter sp.]